MKLLIVEDEPSLLEALRKGFALKGFAVDTAADGEAALALYFGAEYDVIILDLNLPKLDGISVLREIRQDSPAAKVLILSARNEVEDRIVGLDSGANDYLGKPFHFGELEARVRALLRTDAFSSGTSLDCEDISVDTACRRVFLSGQEVSLTPKEYGILAYLLLHKGQIISSETLLEHVWQGDVCEFSGGAVKVHINALRRKLPSLPLHTVRGQGYYVE